MNSPVASNAGLARRPLRWRARAADSFLPLSLFLSFPSPRSLTQTPSGQNDRLPSLTAAGKIEEASLTSAFSAGRLLFAQARPCIYSKTAPIHLDWCTPARLRLQRRRPSPTEAAAAAAASWSWTKHFPRKWWEKTHVNINKTIHCAQKHRNLRKSCTKILN